MTERATNTYETVAGTESNADEQHEPRTVKHTRPDGSVHMMTEIGDGTFVAWSTCRTCSKQVLACTCAGGPVEPEYMQRWRDERFTKSFERRGAEPALPVTLRHRDRRVAAVMRFLLARGYKIEAPLTARGGLSIEEVEELRPHNDTGIIDPDDTSGDSDDPDYGGHVEPIETDAALDAALTKVRQRQEDDSDVGF